MRARRPAAVRTTAATLLALVVLASCSSVEDTARQAASDAAGQATDQAKSAAKDAVTGQVCRLTTGSGPLADGTISADERAAISTVAQAAERAGVPSTYTAPLADVASAQGAAATRAAVGRLTDACAARSTGQ